MTLLSANQVNYDDATTLLNATDIQRAIEVLTSRTAGGGLEVLTSRTLVLTDASLILDANSTDPIVLTVPTNDDVAFPVGTIIYIIRQNTGSVSIVGDTGVSVLSEDNNTFIGAQYTGAVLRKQATNTWNLIGNLTA